MPSQNSQVEGCLLSKNLPLVHDAELILSTHGFSASGGVYWFYFDSTAFRRAAGLVQS